MRFLVSLLLLLAMPALAREGPNNIIFVTAATQGNAGGLYPCTGPDAPYDCCTGAGTGTCDTTVNGADICQALEDCEDVGGCRLQLPEGIIEEAEHVIYGTRSWAMGAGTPCGGNFGTAPDAGFPNGLIVQGKGAGLTILRADSPARSGGDHRSVITLNAEAGLSGAEIPYVVYQNMTVDGMRGLQPTTVGNQNAFTTFFNGAELDTNDALPSVKIRNVHFLGTTSHTVIAGAFILVGETTLPDHPISNGQLHILNSIIEGGGCVQDHSCGTGGPGSGALPCGCDRADAGGNCAGWDDIMDIHGGCVDPTCIVGTCSAPGWKSQGSNITIGIPSNTLIANNFLPTGTHYAVGSGMGLEPYCTVNSPLTEDDFSPGSCGTGWHLHGNRFGSVGNSAIDAHGAYVTRITDNVFDGQKFDDNYFVDLGTDITFANTWQRWIFMSGNSYNNESQHGVVLNIWRPLAGESDSHQDWPAIVVENETYELNCGHCDNPNFDCFPMNLSSGKNQPIGGTYDGDLSDVVFRNLTFTNLVAGNDCAGSVAASTLEREAVAARDSTRNLVIDGGSWVTGGSTYSSDGWGIPGAPTSANPIIGYFNYVVDLTICGSATPSNPLCTPSNPLTITGTGADGRLTLGGDAGHENMTGGCFDTITTSAGATVNNRASLTTPCP